MGGIPTNLSANLLFILGQLVKHVDGLGHSLVSASQVVSDVRPDGFGFDGIGLLDVLVVVDGVDSILLFRLNVVHQGLEHPSRLLRHSATLINFKFWKTIKQKAF